jgi:hypothetical protein
LLKVEKPSVSEDMMVGDAEGKPEDVGIRKNGTKYREDPEVARDISERKCCPGSDRNSRM